MASCKTRTLRILLFQKCVAQMQPLAHLGHRPVADFAANLNARLANHRTSGRTPLDLGRFIRRYGSGTGSDDCLAADGHSDSFGPSATRALKISAAYIVAMLDADF